MGRLQTLQHGRGWGAAGAPLQTPKSPGAPGSPLPELLWEVKHTEPKAHRACSLRAGRGAPGYDSFLLDSFLLPTWPTLTSSLIRLNSQHPELHHHHSLTAKEQFSSFPPSARTAHPPLAALERAPHPSVLPAPSGNKRKLKGSGRRQKQLTRELPALRPRAAPRAVLRGAQPGGLPAVHVSRAPGLGQAHDWPQDRRLWVPRCSHSPLTLHLPGLGCTDPANKPRSSCRCVGQLQNPSGRVDG